MSADEKIKNKGGKRRAEERSDVRRAKLKEKNQCPPMKR
jgi:hypothetical protein